VIVDAKDVKFWEVAEVATSDGPAVRVDGLVFHSSLAVDHIEQRKTDSDLVMEVFLTPAKKGLSGSFTVDVPLAQGFKRILFGPAREQIWPAPVQSTQ
jgi:hypothetical protein